MLIRLYHQSGFYYKILYHHNIRFFVINSLSGISYSFSYSYNDKTLLSPIKVKSISLNLISNNLLLGNSNKKTVGFKEYIGVGSIDSRVLILFVSFKSSSNRILS